MSGQITRERLIDAASHRFYRNGFRDVGLDQILADVGISRTAFYKHFESKDDLLLAAVKAQDEWVREHFRSAVTKAGGKSPRERLLAFFDVVSEIVRREDFRGCFFVNVAIEFPLPHDPAHIAAAENKRAMRTIIEELARDAGADDPHALARELMLVMEGAYVSRQLTGDEGVAEVARHAGEVLIDRRLAGSAAANSGASPSTAMAH